MSGRGAPVRPQGKGDADDQPPRPRPRPGSRAPRPARATRTRAPLAARPSPVAAVRGPAVLTPKDSRDRCRKPPLPFVLESRSLRRRTMTDETAIRALINAQAIALRAKDVDATLAAYSADLVRYDLDPPLRHDGTGAQARREFAAWFSNWRDALGYELRNLVVEADGDVAVAYGYVRISGTATDGARSSVWARRTLGLRRREGAWKIIHEHVSVPFYMDGSFKAAVDLAP